MATKLIICPVCKGRRTVTNYYNNKDDVCPYCGGSGTIVVEDESRNKLDPKKGKK